MKKKLSLILQRIYGAFWITFISLFFSFPIIFVFLGNLLRLISTPRRNRWIAHLVWLWSKWIFKGFPWVKIEIEGLEHLEESPCLYVSNHLSQLDIPLLGLLPGRKVWFSKSTLLWLPFFGQALWAMRSIPVVRSKNFKLRFETYLKHAINRLAMGYSIVIYAEGTRSRTGRLNSFKRGFSRVAHRTQCPIQPCYIEGAFEINPPGSSLVKPGLLKLKIFPRFHVESHHTEEYIHDTIENLFKKHEQNLLNKNEHLDRL